MRLKWEKARLVHNTIVSTSKQIVTFLENIHTMIEVWRLLLSLVFNALGEPLIKLIVRVEQRRHDEVQQWPQLYTWMISQHILWYKLLIHWRKYVYAWSLRGFPGTETYVMKLFFYIRNLPGVPCSKNALPISMYVLIPLPCCSGWVCQSTTTDCDNWSQATFSIACCKRYNINKLWHDTITLRVTSIQKVSDICYKYNKLCIAELKGK